MPAVTVGFPEFESRIMRIRRRINRLRLLDALCMAGAAFLFAAALHTLAAPALSPAVLRWLQIGSLLAATGVTGWAGWRLWCQWLDLEGAAVHIDRCADMSARVATMLAHPHSESRSPLRPILLWEIFDQAARWDVERIAPVGVRRPAIALAFAIAAFLASALLAPERPQPSADQNTGASHAAAIPGGQPPVPGASSGVGGAVRLSSQQRTGTAPADTTSGNSGGDRIGGDRVQGGSPREQSGGGGEGGGFDDTSTHRDDRGDGAGDDAPRDDGGVGDGLDPQRGDRDRAGDIDIASMESAAPAAGVDERLPQSGAEDLPPQVPGSPQRDGNAPSQRPRSAADSDEQSSGAPESEKAARAAPAIRPAGRAEDASTTDDSRADNSDRQGDSRAGAGARPATDDPTKAESAGRHGLLGTQKAGEENADEGAAPMVIQLQTFGASRMEPQAPQDPRPGGASAAEGERDVPPASISATQLEDTALHRTFVSPLHQALVRDLFTPPAQ